MAKKFYTKTFILLLIVLSGRMAFAQTGSISGKVVDDKNKPVSYATVKLQGTTMGATTDDNGAYEIRNVPAGKYILQVSYIGFKEFDQNITVGGAQSVDVGLKQDYLSLNNVVVVGYGTRRVKDLTGSVASVSSKDFNNGNVATPEQLLTGKVAGVQITSNGGAPGSGSRIRIRGGSSLNASNDPLIVIDGVPLDNDKINGAYSPLNLINPNDIENITVLKDASAAAIYGNRAANGVIIITTKKGTAGKFHIGFNTNVSLSTLNNYVSVLSAQQFQNAIDSFGSATQKKLLGNTGVSTDWQKQIYHNVISADNDLSFSGGIKQLPYRVSLEYFADPGVLKRSNLTRYAASVNLEPSFFDNHLKVDLNYKYSYTSNFFTDQGAISSGALFDPTKPVYSDTTYYRPSDSNKTSPLYGGYWEWIDPKTHFVVPLSLKNPVGLIYEKDDESNVYRQIGNLVLNYTLPFLPELRANLNVGGDFSNSNGTTFVPQNAASAFSQNDTASGSSTKYSQMKRNKLFEFYLNYTKDLKDIMSTIDATAGYSYQDWTTSIPAFPSLSATGHFITPAGIPSKFENTLISFYGRVNYTLADRYLLTATLRDDGSSRFSPDNRWGLFPSLAFAWRISDENFLKNSTVLSNLKLRLGYGVTGQQDVNSDYPYIPNYEQGTSTAQYQFGDQYYYVLRPDAYDANIKWEQTTTYNAGLDFGFYNGRVSGSIDYYYKPTKNLLSVIPVPAGTNFSNTLLTNVGSLVNQGVEVSLNFVPYDVKNFRWDLGGNITYNHNEITKLSKVPDTSTTGILVGNIAGGTGNTIQIYSVGDPVGTFYVYKQLYSPSGKPIEAGQIIPPSDRTNPEDSVYTQTDAYYDFNHDGKITPADLYRYKSSEPSITAAIYSSFTWKNWFASFSIRGEFGNYVYNNLSSSQGNFAQVGGQLNFLLNLSQSWLSSGFKNPSSQSFQLLSDYYVKNASFVRCDNLSLGYNFRNLIKKKFDLSLTGVVQNAFIITKYNGIDPEIAGGIDNNFYPRPRIYSLQLNLQL